MTTLYNCPKCGCAMEPPTVTVGMTDAEKVESMCRLWWDCPGPDGKPIATVKWDAYDDRDRRKENYRRRMYYALGLEFPCV